MPTAGLTAFLKEQCANYTSHYDICVLDDGPCDVLSEKKRCGYFEKCVLGPPGYPFKQPGYDYAKVFAQYAETTGAKHGKVEQRRCECGMPLQRRQRYCPKCARSRARQANRERVRKHRFSKSLDVTV